MGDRLPGAYHPHFCNEEIHTLTLDGAVQHSNNGLHLANCHRSVQTDHSSASWEHPMVFQYPELRMKPGRESTATHSTFASTARSSRSNSIFSQPQSRDSIVSTATTTSQHSDYSREHYLSQAENQLTLNSSTALLRCHPNAVLNDHTNITIDEGVDCHTSMSTMPSSQDSVAFHPHQSRRESVKEKFSTCVSRRERAKPTGKPESQPSHWCTSCRKGFGTMSDWKAHEEIFQERFEMYECDLCDKAFFKKGDFTNHHEKTHKCRACSKKNHVEAANRIRKPRAAWGCGFCVWVDTDWDARCAHIALHFKEGMTMSDWSHTHVIWSLLQRPSLQQVWIYLSEQKQILNPFLGWNQQKTGRAEGHPDSGRPPQLQDMLEWYTDDQNPVPVVQLAFDMGLRHAEAALAGSQSLGMRVCSSDNARHTSIPRASNNPKTRASQPNAPMAIAQAGIIEYRRITQVSERPWLEKELPPDPPLDESPLDYINISDNEGAGMVPWEPLMDTIVEDDILPDAAPTDINLISDFVNDEFDWMAC